MKLIKKLYWAVVASLMALLGYTANAIQFVRNTLMFALEIPQTFVNIVTGFMGVSCFFACLIMKESVGGKILAGIGFILILLLLYRLATFAAQIVQLLLAAIVTFVDFSAIIQFATNTFYKAIIHYSGDFGPNEPRIIDNIMLFGVMSVFHFFHKIFDKIRKAICVLVYPAVSGSAFWWIYHEFYGPAFNHTDITIGEHAIAVIMIALVVSLALYFAFCLSSTLRDAAFSVSEMDSLYETWSTAFRHAQPRSKQTNHHKQTNYKNKTEEKTNTYARPENSRTVNKYYDILSKAKDLQELKKTYRALCKQIHPDVSSLPKEKATEEQAKLNDAYTVLKARYS